jgi:aspartate kinase
MHIQKDNQLIVCKFGGSSIADAKRIRRVANILRKNPSRRYVVVSAPGKRNGNDIKLTDILLNLHRCVASGENYVEVLNFFRDRFVDIVKKLGVQSRVDILSEISNIETIMLTLKRPDYIVSRGEYLMAIILAAYLGWEFVDAADLIKFKADGTLNRNSTHLAVREKLGKISQAVIPGFYGSRYRTGKIQILPRGGSDTTGAIIARALKADLYENWTDTNGIQRADPRVVIDPGTVSTMSFEELGELAEAGASVFNNDAAAWMVRGGVPVRIRNTFDLRHQGTLIDEAINLQDGKENHITGIAGRKGFLTITVSKLQIRQQVGFGQQILSIFTRHGVSFEHIPSGKTNLCVVVSETEVNGKLKNIKQDIKDECRPDSIKVEKDLALIAIVGRGLVHTVGSAAKIFSALSAANINIRLIDQGASELAIVVGVNNTDCEKAIQSIHECFFKEEN